MFVCLFGEAHRALGKIRTHSREKVTMCPSKTDILKNNAEYNKTLF